MATLTKKLTMNLINKGLEQAARALEGEGTNLQEYFQKAIDDTEDGTVVFPVNVKIKLEKEEKGNYAVSVVCGYKANKSVSSGKLHVNPDQPDLFKEGENGDGDGEDDDPDDKD